MPTSSRSRRSARARVLIAETWQSQANLSLFLALLVVTGFVLPSMGFGKSDLQLYSDFVFSVMLISGVAIAWGQRNLFLLSAVVAGITLTLRWAALWKPSRTLGLWSNGWSIAAVAIIALVLLAQVFREGPVTHLRIQGAIAVYLLFGVGWAHAYHMVNWLQPGSFSDPVGQLTTAGDWIYYSMVTLTTLGYGDITPVKPLRGTWPSERRWSDSFIWPYWLHDWWPWK